MSVRKGAAPDPAASRVEGQKIVGIGNALSSKPTQSKIKISGAGKGSVTLPLQLFSN